MEYHEKVDRFESFFREKYSEEVASVVSEGKRAVVVDFNDFSKFDSQLADTVLDHPNEGVDAAEEAVSNLPVVESDLLVHFENLPSTEFVVIRNLRSRHIGSMIGVKGIIKRASEVRPELESAIFECKNCGDRYEKEQESANITTPHKCDCGSRSFELVDKVMRDVQTVTIEENPESIRGAEQPRKIGVVLRDDLVDPQFQSRVVPGNKVIINGVLREKAINKDSKRFDLYINANYLETVQREFEEIEIDEEEEEAIEELAEDDDLIDKIISSIAPSIHGHTQIKEAIALQLFSGVRKERPDGTNTRGDIHVLLIGEPGTGKSQLLKFTGQLAPKGKYVVGKAATAAGITATVMKDDITEEWTLEAGALVLANKGIATIDEIDKMDKGDRSSMHEAMEQQCFAPVTNIFMPDGRIKKISDIVEPYLDSESSFKTKSGKEICKLEEKFSVLSVDPETGEISESDVSVVGRRKAPEKMLRIELDNGKELEVTPEHPFYQMVDGEMVEREARALDEGSYIPAPGSIPVNGEEQGLNDIDVNGYQKDVDVPEHNSSELATFIGYQVSDGGYELNRGVKNGFNFTNTDETLVEDYKNKVDSLFGVKPFVREHGNRKEVRVVSKELSEWLQELGPVLEKGELKKIPPRLMRCRKEELRYLVRAFFDGDGGVYQVKRGYRIRAVVENRELLEQIQNILQRFGILSKIYSEENVYRIEINRYGDIRRFKEHIGFLSEDKQEKLEEAVSRERKGVNIVPGVSDFLMRMVQYVGLDQQDIIRTNLVSGQDITEERALNILEHVEDRISEIDLSSLSKDIEELKRTREHFGVSMRELSDRIGVSLSLIGYWEKNGTERKEEYVEALSECLEDRKNKLDYIKNLRDVIRRIRWIKISEIEEKEPEYEYVYDLTVPKNSNFVGEGVVCHNSITVSKANIQATLQCRTSILAAGNPKFGRFDPYRSVGEQIEISDTLISRFDLLFPVKDIPDRSKDKKLSDHIMSMHTDPKDHVGEVSMERLRNFIAYAKRNVHPRITEDAQKILKDFYVDTRQQGSSDDGLSKVPITARQLEALIRLSEASARLRLKDTVDEDDAQRAIDLLTYSLKKIGVINESGEFDIDKLETGMDSESRTKRQVIMKVVNDLGGTDGEAVPFEDVIESLEEEGMDADDAEDVIEELKREGELYEPKQGHIGTI